MVPNEYVDFRHCKFKTSLRLPTQVSAYFFNKYKDNSQNMRQKKMNTLKSV